jgi:hypothetical protein
MPRLLEALGSIPRWKRKQKQNPAQETSALKIKRVDGQLGQHGAKCPLP